MSGRRAHLQVVDTAIPQTPRRPRRERRLPWLVMMLVAGAATATGLFAYQRLSAPPAPEMVALRQGMVEVGVRADALLVRNEHMYLAPASGPVTRLVEEGKRVPVGAEVLEIGPAGSAAMAPVPVRPTDDASRRAELQRLAEEIYRTALAMNIARDRGDDQEQSRLSSQLERLVREQWEVAQGVQSVAPPVAPRERTVGSTVVTAGVSGIVSYQRDGLEGNLRPADADSWTPAWFFSLPLPTSQPIGPGQAQEGEMIFKIIENLQTHLVMVVPSADLPRGAGPGHVQIRFGSKGGRLYTAQLQRVERDGPDALLLLTLTVYPEELNLLRRTRVSVVFDQVSGLVVPRSALDFQGGRAGIWYDKRGSLTFMPVRVIGGNQEEVAIETDLGPGAMVALEPPAPKGAR